MTIKSLAREIHTSNVYAGWWPENRNRGEVMMLIISEIAEAVEGYEYDLKDDKLPDEYMFDVELADTAIRLLDLCGVDADNIPVVWEARLAAMDDELSGDIYAYLMRVVVYVSKAMEGHRRGNIIEYGENLWNALATVYCVAESYEIDLDRIISLKREFNATRQDHRLENRLKAGGKAY